MSKFFAQSVAFLLFIVFAEGVSAQSPPVPAPKENSKQMSCRFADTPSALGIHTAPFRFAPKSGHVHRTDSCLLFGP